MCGGLFGADPPEPAPLPPPPPPEPPPPVFEPGSADAQDTAPASKRGKNSLKVDAVGLGIPTEG